MTGRETKPGHPLASADETAHDHDRAVFARVAETHPGVIRTVSILITELSELDGLAPDLRHALGDHLRRVGETVIRHADRTAAATTARAGGTETSGRCAEPASLAHRPDPQKDR